MMNKKIIIILLAIMFGLLLCNAKQKFTNEETTTGEPIEEDTYYGSFMGYFYPEETTGEPIEEDTYYGSFMSYFYPEETTGEPIEEDTY